MEFDLICGIPRQILKFPNVARWFGIFVRHIRIINQSIISNSKDKLLYTSNIVGVHRDSFMISTSCSNVSKLSHVFHRSGLIEWRCVSGSGAAIQGARESHFPGSSTENVR